MRVSVTAPDRYLRVLRADGSQLSRHLTIEDAIESAANAEPGDYRIVYPERRVRVYGVRNPDGSSSDTQAPTVPANLSAVATSPTDVSLSWSASTDNVGVAGYQVFRDGVPLPPTQATSMIDGGRAPSTTYSYTVTAYDAAGNVSAPSSAAQVTTAANSPPSWPTVAQQELTVGTSYLLTLAPTDDSGQVTVAISAGTLPAGLSFDAATKRVSGVPSAVETQSVTFTASDGIAAPVPITITFRVLTADVTAPSVPASLLATAVSRAQINLSWSASTDTGSAGERSTGVASYRVYRDGSLRATVAGTTYSDTALAASTQYSYTVAAVDGAGNASAQSAAAVATTFAINTDPVWNTSATLADVTENTPFAFVLEAEDADGDDIIFTALAALPGDVTITANTQSGNIRTVTLSSEAGLPQGVYEFNLDADDQQNDPFEPSILNEAQPTQFLVVDTGTGPNPESWNNKLYIDWDNANQGDYTGTSGDPLNTADDTPQGGTPFATSAVVSTTGPISIDVANLVRRALLTGENKGFHIKATGTSVSFTLGGRLNADPAARPTLSVVTSDGTFPCSCTASAYWDVGSALSKDGTSTTQVNTTNRTTLLNFDLSAVTGSVTSATLQVYATARSGTNTRLVVFESNPPTFILGAGALTPETGLALEYPGDNFGSDPRIYKAWNFAGVSTDGSGNVIWINNLTGMSTSYRYAWVPMLGKYVRWGVSNAGEVIADPDAPGTSYFRGEFQPATLANQVSRRDGLNCLHSFLGLPLASDANGLYPLDPANKIEEVYFRMYFMLEDDFVSTVEGFKSAITINLQIGHWIPIPGHFNGQGGYWDGTGGNGGTPNPGTHSILTTGYPNHHEYKGNMQRMENGVPAAAGVTYEQIMPFIGYNYHIDHSAYPPPIAYSNLIRSKLHKGRWYCVEQYLKLNTVVGPFDALNNGTALYDGTLITWVDGVRVDYRGPANGTGYRWRVCPDMGIGAVGTTWYMGGQAIHPADEPPQHYRVSHFVAASEYIGPRVRP